MYSMSHYLLQIWHSLLHHLVEDMVRPLHLLLEGDARLLQEIRLNVTPGQLALGVEVDADELAKPGAVVVPGRLGVAKGLQDGIGLDNLVFKRGLLGRFLLFLPGSHHGKVGDDLLGVLGLASSGFSAALSTRTVKYHVT